MSQLNALRETIVGDPRRWVQFFSRHLCGNWFKNWYLHFQKTFDHRIWQAGTSRTVYLNETNQAGASDIIMSRSCDFEKILYSLFNKGYCRFSYVGNWGLVKSIVGTTFRSSYLCLHSQAGNRLWQLMDLLFFIMLR